MQKRFNEYFAKIKLQQKNSMQYLKFSESKIASELDKIFLEKRNRIFCEYRYLKNRNFLIEVSKLVDRKINATNQRFRAIDGKIYI